MGDRVRKSNKKHRCDECKQEFARADHLARHYLLHSGVKPYSCLFCDELFGRCDSLRRHYAGCTKRADRPVPETDNKGRRRHACQPCAAMKLRCEGIFPCKSCQRRGTSCTRATSLDTRSAAVAASSSSSANTPTAPAPRTTEPGSIKFLLNAGEAGFIADWRMPDGSDTVRRSIQTVNNDPLTSYIGQSVKNYDFDPATSGLVEAFEAGPWAAYRQQWQENNHLSGAARIWPSGQEGIWDNDVMPDDAGLDNVVASALINVLNLTISRLEPDSAIQRNMSADIAFLMTPERIARFIESYKTIWHLNCPVVHVANLDTERIQLTLLVPIVLMGAMYTTDEREMAVAKSLLDVAEMYCFASDVLSPEAEIRRALGGKDRGVVLGSWDEFQQFQGAYLMVATQFWAGNRAARNRAMECRFSEIIKVARSIGLVKAAHSPEDRYNQTLWVQNESRIRTMSIIFCLDCAFLFFRSYPCRLSYTELDFEMPCEEPVWNSKFPFQHSRFGCRAPLTLKEGIEMLSCAHPETTTTPSPSSAGSQPPPHPLGDASRFTMLSMFILIHMLYAFISNRLSLPWLNTRVANGGNDHFLEKIRLTLDRWSVYWDTVMATTSPEALQMAGLFRNGRNYLMVAQLLLQKRSMIEGDELMIPKCEDKWARMSALA